MKKKMKDILGDEWIDEYVAFYYPSAAKGLEPEPPLIQYIRTGNVEPFRELLHQSAKTFESKIPEFAETMLPLKEDRASSPDLSHDVLDWARLPGKTRHAVSGSWRGAAIAGDVELGRRIARAVRLPPVKELAENPYKARLFCLRHVMAGDDDEAIELAKVLEPGYIADVPPEFVEFPIGVINRDADLVLEGVRKTNTRFKGKWNEGKWRKWYERNKAGRRMPRTWETCLDATKKSLFSYDYIIAWWALAWLNVASWCGMDDVFEDPKKFSEWVPITLARRRS